MTITTPQHFIVKIQMLQEEFRDTFVKDSLIFECNTLKDAEGVMQHIREAFKLPHDVKRYGKPAE